MTKKILAIGAAAVLLLGGGGYALQQRGEEGTHSVTPEIGGTWDYGASGGLTWSSFKHDQPHRATVLGHTYVDSGCVPGGEWAHARTDSKWFPITPNEQNIELCEKPDAQPHTP